MLDSLRGCLGRPPKASEAVSPQNCIFCNVTAERGFRMSYKDDTFTVFHDRSPGARLHLLCVPNAHIDNVRSLRSEDIEMLHRMSTLGHELLEAEGFIESQRQLGFHIPPFFSVNHLHLHIFGLPFVSRWDRIKYRVARSQRRHKGVSQFVELSQAISILEAGGRVKVGRC